MSNVKLAPTRILQVIPSDYCNIPYPTVAFEDRADVSVANDTDLIYNGDEPFIVADGSGNYINIVNPGDVIYFEDDNLAATVSEVLSSSLIRINASILSTSQTYSYTIYQNSLFPNQGCQLYFSDSLAVAPTIRFSSAGMDSDTSGQGYVFAKALPQLFPLQIVKLWAADTSTDTTFFALW